MRVAPTSRVSPVPELFGVDTEPSAPPRSRITTSTTKASFVLLMMAWLTSVVAFFSSGWIVLEGSVVFKQGGEQHDVNLSLGLWRVTYAASRRVRGNVVGEVDSTSSLCGQKRELAPGTEVVQGTCRLVTFARVASALSWAVPPLALFASHWIRQLEPHLSPRAARTSRLLVLVALLVQLIGAAAACRQMVSVKATCVINDANSAMGASRCGELALGNGWYLAACGGAFALLSLVGFVASGGPIHAATPKDDGFSLVPTSEDPDM